MYIKYLDISLKIQNKMKKKISKNKRKMLLYDTKKKIIHLTSLHLSNDEKQKIVPFA